jgi:cobalamin biosynthesis protein CobT
MSDETLDNTSPETSDLDVLNEGADNEEETSEETSSEETESEESPEDESLEDSDEEEEESSEESEEESEEEELEEPEITRPSWRMIKEKFPELAKDKDFREMFHREKAYTETFPTIEEAKSAKEKADVLDFFAPIMGTPLDLDVCYVCLETTLLLPAFWHQVKAQ